MKKLDKKILKVWYTHNLIPIISLFVAIIAIILFVKNLTIILINIGLFIILISLLIIWPILRYNACSYNYTDRNFEIKKGVIFRSHVIVPIRTIQDLHSYQTPLMLIFKTSGIIISTAGSNFTIQGISKDIVDTMLFDLENNLNNRLDEE